jgi:hypothetical protein
VAVSDTLYFAFGNSWAVPSAVAGTDYVSGLVNGQQALIPLALIPSVAGITIDGNDNLVCHGFVSVANGGSAFLTALDAAHAALGTATCANLSVAVSGVTVAGFTATSLTLQNVNTSAWLALQCGDLTVHGILNATLPAGATLFVDQALGSDGTGTRANSAKPFATLAAALAAASSGDLIWVRPGTYAEGGLWKAGVNWHFEPGAVIAVGANATVFDDSSGAGDCTITGSLVFSRPALDSAKAFNLTHGSRLNLTCTELSAGVVLTGGGPHYLRFDRTRLAAVPMTTTDCSASFYFDYAYVTFTHSGTGTDPTAAGAKPFTQVIYGNRLDGSMTVNNAGAQYLHLFDAPSWTVNGTAVGIAKVGTVGAVSVNGGTVSLDSGPCTAIVQTGGTLTAKGLTVGPTSVDSNSGVTISGGTLRLRDCYLTGRADDDPHWPLEITGSPTVILDNSTLVQLANPDGASVTECMSAPNPFSLRVYGTVMANLPKPATVTLLCGTLTVDSDVT